MTNICTSYLGGIQINQNPANNTTICALPATQSLAITNSPGNVANCEGIFFNWGSNINIATVNPFVGYQFGANGLATAGYVQAASFRDANGVQILGAQQSNVADSTDSTNCADQLNELLSRLRAHGIISS